MSTVAALAALVVCMALVPASAGARKHTAAANCGATTAIPTPATTKAAELSVFCLLNVERTSRGLRSLKLSSKLSKASRFQSNDMVVNHYFDHEHPGRPGLVKRIRRTGYLTGARAWSVGENIAWGTGDYSTPASLVKAWMNSSGHRQNILNPAFRDIGVGIVSGAPTEALEDDDTAATATTDFGKRF